MNWLQGDILYKGNCNRGNTFVNCRTLHHYFRNILEIISFEEKNKTLLAPSTFLVEDFGTFTVEHI